MTTDQKEAAIQRLADEIVRRVWLEQPDNPVPPYYLNIAIDAARIAIDKAVVPACWQLLRTPSLHGQQHPTPWDAVCAGEKEARPPHKPETHDVPEAGDHCPGCWYEATHCEQHGERYLMVCLKCQKPADAQGEK